MPNPSIATSALYEELEAARARYHNLSLSKRSREIALADVREIEAVLDLPEAERTPNHNGRPAQPVEQTHTVNRFDLLLLIAAANAHADDWRSGVEDGTYENREGLDKLDATIAKVCEQINK